MKLSRISFLFLLLVLFIPSISLAQVLAKVYDGRKTNINATPPSNFEVELIRSNALSEARQYWGNSESCNENFEVVDSISGSFTRPNAAQRAILYRFCVTGHDFGNNGIVILEGGKIVAHVVYSGGEDYSLGSLSDLNSNGSSELVIGDGSMHQGYSDSQAYVIEISSVGVRKFGLAHVYADNCGAKSPCKTTVYNILAKPGSTPIFYRETYSKNKERWTKIGTAAPFALINDTRNYKLLFYDAKAFQRNESGGINGSTNANFHRQITLDAKEYWHDTGITLSNGQRLTIVASGRWCNGGADPCTDPGGLDYSYPGLILSSAPLASLIGKVGNSTFVIGRNYSGKSSDSGTLLLSMNDIPDGFIDNSGTINIQINVEPGNSTPAGTIRQNSIGMQLAWIPPGDFIMGSENGRSNEKPVHKITISKGFLIGKDEVTQEQWQAVMGNNPSNFKGCPKCPVERVSWHGAQDFINKLNSKNDGFIYRLPTEGEWEYACRAGTTADYYGDLDSIAWYYSNSGHKTHPVEQKQPNAFGLYDMLGNVWEWCEDVWNENYDNLPTDGSANESAGNTNLRVMRGGSWGVGAIDSRSAYRTGTDVSLPNGDGGGAVGFRVVAHPANVGAPNIGRVIITGFIDVIEITGAGCRIRFISGDKSYTGIISFDRLSVLAGRRIRSYEDAVAFFEGKQINVTLSGITASSDSFSTGSFGGITKITVLPSKGPIPTKPQWKETTTATETIIDLSTDILFDFNKSTINPKAVPSLIKLARLLRQSKSNNVQLNGFTDSIGGDEYNVTLSQRRSEAVKQWLVTKGGIDAARLTTNGYGKSQPAAPNTNPDGSDNPTGRQKNRRVEIRIPR